MALDVELTFRDLPVSPLTSPVVHRVTVRDALSDLFEVVLHVASTELGLDLERLLGQPATVAFLPAGDGAPPPPLPRIVGIVRRMRQLVSVVPNDDAAALYEVTVAPFVWLSTRSSGRRVFQNLSVPEIVRLVLTGYGASMPAVVERLGTTYAPREYCVQHDETDWDFICRLLSEEHVATYIDHATGALTLVDDTSVMTLQLSQAVLVAATSAMVTSALHVDNVVPAAQLETSKVALRDHDFTHPALTPEGHHLIFAAELPANEANLEAYVFQEEKFTSSEGDARAEQLLDTLRAEARSSSLSTSFALAPGTRLSLTGHPTRQDANAELVVVRLDTELDDGDGGAEPTARHTLDCVATTNAWYPPVRPKPRVAGTQTGVVVGDGSKGTVEVDSFGRVKLELRWDRRDLHAGNPTRWTRVAQAWAGQGFGLVTLPRIGDEVIVTYVEGDPDEPLIVGRVHNAVQRTPLDLPERDKTMAVWRSRSFGPGGLADGFNQILMDDAVGLERFEIHAQRDSRFDTGRNSATTVGVNETKDVGGSSTNHIVGPYSLTSASTSISTGPYHLEASSVDVHSRSHINLDADDIRKDKSTNHFIDSGSLYVKLRDVCQIRSPKLHGFCGPSIMLTCNGSSTIDMTPGKIDVTSSGPISVTGSKVTLSAGGSTIEIEPGGIKITSGGAVQVNGSFITLN